MSIPSPQTHLSVECDVGAAEADFNTNLEAGKVYELVSNTACWIKQGSAMVITCATKAEFIDNETLTITVDGVDTIYDFDTDGVNDGDADHTRVNISAETSAANVAVILAAAIAATQTDLDVTDNLDGTIKVVKVGGTLTMSNTVADITFAHAAGTGLAATAGSESTYTPANFSRYLDPKYGPTVSIIRDAASGKASLTPVRFLR